MLEMGLQQINASAMQRHGRCIRQGNSLLRHDFKATMLPFRIARVSLEQQRNRSQSITVLVSEWSAEFEQECQATIAQSLTGPHDGIGFRARAHGIKLLGGLQPSLQARAIKRVLQVNR